MGVVDASLAAQNMAIAAESMGLGICYIGSLRNDVKKASEILGLPDGAFPLFGMVAGYPTEEGSQKERLPFEAVYHENTYQRIDEVLKEKGFFRTVIQTSRAQKMSSAGF